MSGWINCSDRLPPGPGSYLTHSPQSPYPIHIGVWLEREKAWEHEWHRKKRREIKPKTWITHWHELPALPA